jgi:putative spermidine/putrescine transport system ATP-binding protein
MVIMHDGIVQQVGKPDDLYERPANIFVADFLGKMNFFIGSVNEQGVFACDSGILLKTVRQVPSVKTLGVRPERVSLADQPLLDNSIQVAIQAVAYLGSHIDVTAQYADQRSLRCQIANTSAIATNGLTVGSSVWANFKAEDCVFLDS